MRGRKEQEKTLSHIKKAIHKDIGVSKPLLYSSTIGRILKNITVDDSHFPSIGKRFPEGYKCHTRCGGHARGGCHSRSGHNRCGGHARGGCHHRN